MECDARKRQVLVRIILCRSICAIQFVQINLRTVVECCCWYLTRDPCTMVSRDGAVFTKNRKYSCESICAGQFACRNEIHVRISRDGEGCTHTASSRTNQFVQVKLYRSI
jgi:hypothetical protein